MLIYFWVLHGMIPSPLSFSSHILRPQHPEELPSDKLPLATYHLGDKLAISWPIPTFPVPTFSASGLCPASSGCLYMDTGQVTISHSNECMLRSQIHVCPVPRHKHQPKNSPAMRVSHGFPVSQTRSIRVRALCTWVIP